MLADGPPFHRAAIVRLGWAGVNGGSSSWLGDGVRRLVREETLAAGALFSLEEDAGGAARS